jgi:hypothetical protein
MSCLKWKQTVWFSPLQAGDRFEVKRQGYELELQGIGFYDPFYVPLAEIEKLGHKKWQLRMKDGTKHTFTTLKAAKAMGIALYRMDNDG